MAAIGKGQGRTALWRLLTSSTVLSASLLGAVGGLTPSSVSYDTSIGNGVDTNGFASLPLRAGAKYIYVNSSTGSDANSGLTNALAVATISKAASLVTAGAGDQVLIAEGTTYSASFPRIEGISGFSAAYPLVFQSYDATDPTNTAKYGRASGSNRPTFTNTIHTPLLGAGATSHLAFRGLDFNSGNVADAVFDVLSGPYSVSNVLFENCRFQYVLVSVQGQAAHILNKVIFRNCSGHGQWSTSGDQQWVYAAYVDGLTIEDCAVWHAGWKEGANRSDAANVGGATIYSHPIYLQDNCRNSIVRRSVLVDCAADGGAIKSGGLYQNNLVLNCPISVATCGGNEYSTDAPNGVPMDIAGCAAFGMSDIAGGGNGWGFSFGGNSIQGSTVRNCLLARSANSTGTAYIIKSAPDALQGGGVAPYSFASFANITNSVSYLVSASGGSTSITSSGATTTATFSNNVWDDPTSGSNINVGSVTFPNAYTVSSLLTAINPAYTSLSAAYTDWTNNPEQRGWRTGVGLALTGYAVPVASLVNLTTTMSLTVGVPSWGQLIGALDGSTFSASGLPTGVTLDPGGGPFWRYDGTGSASSGSATITETNGASSHNTTVSWNVYAQPVLSSLTVTPGSTTSSATVSTTVGSGTLYWMVSTDANVPDWPHIRLNINQDNSAEPANNFGVTYGSQAISASGSQSISSITGLTASTAYYMYAAQIDANGNPSATASSSFTTSAPPAPTLSVPVAATNKTIGVTTNANTGTMYWVVTTSSTAPTAAQIKAGQNNAGGAAVASGNKAIAVAAKWATAVSGLTNGTTYYGYFVHNNSSGDSNVAATGSFVPAASTSQWSAANSNAAWAISGGSSNVGTHSGGAWNTLRDNNANTLGVIVHTITTLSTDLRLGLSLASVGTAGSGNEAATVSWDAYSGQFYVAGTLIGTYQAYAAGDGSTVTIIFNNGYVYFYLGSTLVTSYDVSALGTSLYPTAFSNASSVVTTTFTNW